MPRSIVNISPYIPSFDPHRPYEVGIIPILHIRKLRQKWHEVLCSKSSSKAKPHWNPFCNLKAYARNHTLLESVFWDFYPIILFLSSQNKVNAVLFPRTAFHIFEDRCNLFLRLCCQAKHAQFFSNSLPVIFTEQGPRANWKRRAEGPYQSSKEKVNIRSCLLSEPGSSKFPSTKS